MAPNALAVVWKKIRKILKAEKLPRLVLCRGAVAMSRSMVVRNSLPRDMDDRYRKIIPVITWSIDYRSV